MYAFAFKIQQTLTKHEQCHFYTMGCRIAIAIAANTVKDCSCACVHEQTMHDPRALHAAAHTSTLLQVYILFCT